MVAPACEPLRGEVEVDEGFLGGRDTDLRGGRQRDGKPLVGVAVEVRGNGSGRLRLQLLPDASAASLTPLSPRASPPARSSTPRAGPATAACLPPASTTRRTNSAPASPTASGCCHAHRALSNLKTWPQGTHHGVSPKHLQVYLDELVFRHNRRRTPLPGFQTLLGLGAAHLPSTYHKTTRRQPRNHRTEQSG